MENNNNSKLNADLIRATQEMGSIHKSKSVRTGSYSYTYADIKDILQSIKPALSKYNLFLGLEIGISQTGAELIICKIVHTSGEEKVSQCYLNSHDDMKKWAAEFSYKGRYLICKILSLELSDDVDQEYADDDNHDFNNQPITSDVIAKLKTLSADYQTNILKFNRLSSFEQMTNKQYNALVETWNKNKN